MSSPPEVTGRRLVRNTSVNAIAGVVSAALTIVLTPYLLHRLGAADYGIWLLATTLTFSSGYLALADLGLSEATVRFIAAARARNDGEAVNHIVSTTLVVFAAGGLALGAVVIGAAGLLSDVFDVDAASRSLARDVFAIVGLQVAVDLPAAAFLAVIEGAQRYVVHRSVDVGARVLWGLLVMGAVALGHSVLALAVLSLAVAVVRASAAVAGAAFVQRGLRVRVSYIRRAVLRQVMGFASAVFGMRILSVVYWQMDRAIIGVALSAVAVSQYEVAFRLHSTALFALSIIPSAIMPAAAYLAAENSAERLRALYLRGTKYAVGLSLSVTLGALLFARWIIVAWVGEDYESVTGAARLFLVYPAFASVHVIGLAILVGLGRMRRVVGLNALAVGMNVVVSIVLAPRVGINGVIVGTLVGYLFIWLPYTHLFLEQFGVEPREWARAVLLPAMPGAVLQVGLATAILNWISRPSGLLPTALFVAVDIAAGIAGFVLIGLGRDERLRFRQMVFRG